MIRFVALAVLAALAGCGPAQEGYVHGGATTGYSHGYYDQPYWGPSYQPGPVYRGQPRGSYGYHGDPRGGYAYRGDPRGGQHDGSARSRQFWGNDRPQAQRPGPPPREQGGFWGGGQRAAPAGPRGGGGPPMMGSGPRERQRTEQGAN